MKFLLIAMALLSTPAFADASDTNSEIVTDAQAKVGISFGFGWGTGPGWGHPGWGPGYPSVRCVAENYRGMRYVGYGRFPEEAAQSALDNCYYAGSRYCEVRWCR